MPRNIAPDIEHLRVQALTAVDEAAGRARARYITEQPGQGAEYEAKAVEADRLLVDEVPGDTPLLSAEAVALGVSVHALAKQVRTARERSMVIVAKVAGLRRPAKVDIDGASTVAAIARRRSQAVAALDAL